MSPAWRSASALSTAGRKVLFLDRDGVLIRDADYLADPDGVEILPGVPQALRRARAAGFGLVGVSNQSGIGRGFFRIEQFEAVMRRLDELLRIEDAELDAFYYCPHAPDENCRCRKPLPGLLEEASADTAWDRRGSWVVGDKPSDIQLARDADLSACLVRTGYGRAQEAQVRSRWPEDPQVLYADDLAAAVEKILAHDFPERRP